MGKDTAGISSDVIRGYNDTMILFILNKELFLKEDPPWIKTKKM